MKNPLMKNAKDTIKLGMGSMVGMGSLGIMQGALGKAPGMTPEAKTGMASTTGIVGMGLNLANIGQMAKTGMAVVNTVKPKKKNKKNKKK